METPREQGWQTDEAHREQPAVDAMQDGFPVDPDAPRERAKRFLNTKHDNLKGKAHNAGGAVKDAAYAKTPDRFKHASDLQVRFRTGFVYVAVSVICVLVNDITTVAYLALVSAVCAGEFYFMMRADAKLVNEWMGIIAAICYPVSVYLWVFSGPWR